MNSTDPRYISADARPALTPIAADTSAAAASQESQAHNARSSPPQRRRTNSAIAANRRAAADPSARVADPISATTPASSTTRNPVSNIHSIVGLGYDNLATWISVANSVKPPR